MSTLENDAVQDQRGRAAAGTSRRRRGPGVAGAANHAGRLRFAILQFYYRATPLFFLADAIWGISVRASFLPRQDLRFAYYAFCMACAVGCHRRPELTPFVGIGESAINLLLIALGVLLPIWGAADAVVNGTDMPALMTAPQLFNIMLSGSVLILAFHGHQRRIARRLGLPSRWSGRPTRHWRL